MYRQFVFIVFLCFVVGFTACEKPKPDILTPIIEAQDISVEKTTLVIKRLSDNKFWLSNPKRAETRFIPASTSKIPHTLIALETKQALPDTIFKWDGRERFLKSWNQDQTLAQAYQRSAVWVYQEIAQKLGHNVMAEWLKQLDYGNHDIGDADNVTRYWLQGPLEISALEQVHFLEKLSKNELPLSMETYEKSRAIFKNETKGASTLFAKTGWMHDDEAMDIGWFVGWVETSDTSETYVFALNIDMPNASDIKKRKPIVMNALKAIGAWPE